MTSKGQSLHSATSHKHTKDLETMQLRLKRLYLIRQGEMLKKYSKAVVTREVPEAPAFPNIGMKDPSTPRRPKTVPPTRRSVEPKARRPTSPRPVLQVRKVVMKKDEAIVEMNIKSDESDEPQQNEDEDIVYPDGVTDRRPYQTVARYRRMMGKSTNFKEEPLLLGEDQSETTVIGLDAFAFAHGCDLIFTHEEHRFDNSIYRAACGVADLGSIHLLAMDAIQTATFCLIVDLDFAAEFQQVESKVEAFVNKFCQAMAADLECDASNIRVFSIARNNKDKKKSDVKFGLTTPDMATTEKLAERLKVLFSSSNAVTSLLCSFQAHASSGFTGDKLLNRIMPRDYSYEWRSVLQALKIRPSDLDPAFNYDYRHPSTPSELQRGSTIYYLPRGWYRHALRVLDKYEKDPAWIGHVNAKGEWPVAYHGTKSWAAPGITQQGLKIDSIKMDAKRTEAIEQLGDYADRPGLYVATHCDGGASIYTEPFTVKTLPKQNESYRIVFQCRVKPEKFSTHKSPVSEGHAWRYVDSSSIRPYGILLKKEP